MSNEAIQKTLCVEYARVSTTHDEQSESCENQIKLCDEYVNRHPELMIADRFIDDGITGSTDNRPQFQLMLERIQQGDIRYILAKNEDRLCRSTEVDGYLQRKCREYRVEIIFTDSGRHFNPYNFDDVTMHGFMAVMGQQFVFKQSEHGRIAHEQKCKERRLNATDVRYGYKWD